MRNSILVAFGAVLSATSLVAQSDPISGKWGRDGATVLDLKLEAKQAGGPNILDGLRGGFDEVHTAVTKSADMVPADKYSYRPVATVRTFGELVAHIADSYAWYCSRASGRDAQWSDAIEKGKTDKATITQKLRESVAVCNAAYASTGSNLGSLMANIAHTNLHYGNIITYLRMMGLVPPTS